MKEKSEKIMIILEIILGVIPFMVFLMWLFKDLGISEVIGAVAVGCGVTGFIAFGAFALVKVGSDSAKKRAKKDTLSKIDFSKEKGLYRDILKEYSIAEIGYIDNLEIKEQRDIVAILLSLKLKGKIEINDTSIVIIDEEINGLKKVEKYIMESIKENKVKVKSPKYYLEKYVREEVFEDKLIHRGRGPEKIYSVTKKKKENVEWIIILLASILVISWFICMQYIDESSKGFITFVYGIVGMIGVVFCSTYATGIDNATKRTEKGEELNEKIEGLKNYIQNYSLLEESKQNELALWDEYLIYSVIFDINTKIVDEMSHLIEYE